MVRDLHPNANGNYSEDRLEILVIGSELTKMNRGKQPLSFELISHDFNFLMEILRSQIIIDSPKVCLLRPSPPTKKM